MTCTVMVNTFCNKLDWLHILNVSFISTSVELKYYEPKVTKEFVYKGCKNAVSKKKAPDGTILSEHADPPDYYPVDNMLIRFFYLYAYYREY